MDVRALVVGGDVGPELRAGLERLTGLTAGRVRPGTLFVGRDLPRPASDFAWVHAPMAGVDALVAEHAPWPAGTLLTRTVGAMADRMAEYVVGWVLAGPLHVAPTRRPRALPARRRGGRAAAARGRRRRRLLSRHQPQVPAPPLNGPFRSAVIQPP